MDFEIWSEGSQSSDGLFKAHFHGISKGQTFKDACVNMANNEKDFADYFNAEKMTYWGCELFDNKSDASKSFG